MRLDGKALAQSLLTDLKTDVFTLKEQGVIPTLAVIQVGDDPASMAYIRQKQKAAEGIGAGLVVSNQELGIRNQELKTIIEQYNSDPNIHGIIVQRPLPQGLKTDGILPMKDVDGFLPNSPYPVPVASAVLKIIQFACSELRITNNEQTNQHIVIIGRGETAGKPIADLFIKRGYTVSVVHSQTPNPDAITKTADIIVSCVGKPNVVRRDNIKRGVMLISVGITRGADGKLHGDYEEDQITELALCYTPTPGGVGPVNVACLMANLIQAAKSIL